MKNIIGLLLVLFTATVSLAGKTGDDTWQIGNPTSGVNKKLIFDTGDGAANKYFLLDNSLKEFSTNVDKLTIGTGTTANQGIVFNRGGSNPAIRWNESNSVLEFSNDGTSYTNIGSGSGGGGSGLSILATNPDFEQSLALGWTATGMSFTAVTSGSNLLFGKQSALVDSSASGQTLISDSYTIPVGLYGANCGAQIYYKGGDSTYKLQVLDGSSAVIQEHALPGANAIAGGYAINFKCPSSGSMKLALASTANGAAMAIDRMSMGEASNIGQVAQAKHIGSLKSLGTSSCQWQNLSNNTTYVGFSPVSACPTPVVTGQAQAPATKIPAVSFSSLPPGDYVITANAEFEVTGEIQWTISDGTTNAQDNGMYSGATSTSFPAIEGHFHYNTAQSNVTFQVVSKSFNGSGASYIVGSGPDLTFNVYYYPSSSQQTFTPAQVANSWNGYFTNNCTWSFSGTSSFSDANGISSPCSLVERVNNNFGTVKSWDDGTLGNNYPGIIFTPSRPGTYQVCANIMYENGATNDLTQWRIADQSNVEIGESSLRPASALNFGMTSQTCGLYKAGSVSPTTIKVQGKSPSGSSPIITPIGDGPEIEWTIFQIDQQLPAPLVINSVVSASAGVESIQRIKIAQCTSDPCTITSQSGSWVTAVNRAGTGAYILHIAAGTFSATPSCTTMIEDNSTNGFVSNSTSNVNTSTVLNLTSSVSGGGLTDYTYFLNVICMGPK